eukprot:TRINITY_DN4396_c0_g1_i2.p2 TRINITY_DN4396_c0_g1~~TRINITY_DN4396_c0_g1_i2.p2  ORF type:complete len:180 (+),score=5.34 TRINITY_DN4396_c0_g1_i2:272-811(+)
MMISGVARQIFKGCENETTCRNYTIVNKNKQVFANSRNLQQSHIFLRFNLLKTLIRLQLLRNTRPFIQILEQLFLVNIQSPLSALFFAPPATPMMIIFIYLTTTEKLKNEEIQIQQNIEVLLKRTNFFRKPQFHTQTPTILSTSLKKYNINKPLLYDIAATKANFLTFLCTFSIYKRLQ